MRGHAYKFKGWSIERRFWHFVDKSGECWTWTGHRTPEGYGRLIVGRNAKSKGINKGAHRLSYELHHGPIPHGLVICHRCDVPACVRPDHLFVGTYQDNMRDMVAKGRHPWKNRTHCRHGHEYTPENTYPFRGRRFCRACNLVATWKKRGKLGCQVVLPAKEAS